MDDDAKGREEEELRITVERNRLQMRGRKWKE